MNTKIDNRTKIKDPLPPKAMAHSVFGAGLRVAASFLCATTGAELKEKYDIKIKYGIKKK